MRRKISISLPPETADELDRWADSHGLSRSAAVREAVQEYLFNRRFLELRRELMAQAAAQGLHTDEDIFREVS
jgi:metal-responsive CopG/Arc/MetJ family transcriptional regulator